MSLSIRQAIERIESGQIRIPAFQRGFVWDPDLVAHFMDSIYKGYPFGTLILWRTKNQLKAERQLGPFPLSEHDPDYPIDYVLDGQQRLTSIFGVFQSVIEPEEQAPWTRIYFDMSASEDLQESRFFALNGSDVDPDKYFPIYTFFDVTEYRRATERLNDEQVRLIDQVQSAFKEATLPVQLLETDDRAKVAIVFERVNRLGVELDVFQLLSAWTWSEEFDLQTEFLELSAELEPFGFAGVGEDTNLLLRSCAGIVAGDPAPDAVIGLSGSEVRDRFAEITNGIKGAIDFVRANFHVQMLDNLPYPSLLVPLAAYFAKPSGAVPLIDHQRRELCKWFWRACFSRRFSAGVLKNLKRDIAEAVKLRDGDYSSLAEIPCPLDKDFFAEQGFTINAVNTKTFILLLAQQAPLSFVSGNQVSLAEVLQRYNRREFHHLFPQSFLKSQRRNVRDINKLANFAFISAADNKILGGTKPSEYRTHVDTKLLPKILEHALCPASLFDDDYDQFIEDRSIRLLEAAKRLIE
jgi:hypothetical protein